jgi:hypothetical protein
MTATSPISDDPIIPFRVSHATAIAMLVSQMHDISAWTKLGVAAGVTLLAAILTVLLMKGGG